MLWNQIKCHFFGHDWALSYYLRCHVCERCGSIEDEEDNLYDE